MASRNWKTGVLKRRSNLLYRLRKKGVRVDTKFREIYIPYGEDPFPFTEVCRLREEYHFNIQYVIS